MRVGRLLSGAGTCPVRVSLLLRPLCCELHAAAAAGGGGGVSISSWAVKAENPASLGPSPPLLLCFLGLSSPLCVPAYFPVILLTSLSCVFLPSFLSSPFHLG